MSTASFRLSPAPPVAFGIDRIERLGQDVATAAGADARVLLVVDPGVAALGMADRVEAILRAAGCPVALFTGIRSDPLGSQIDGATEQARSAGAACVVGLGGGSALDVAKMAAALATADRPADDYQLMRTPLPARSLAKILIPTTAGTGSETTRTAVYTSAAGIKVWAWGDVLRADLALLDPRLTVRLPPPLTAATGIDALVHAIEACTNRNANVFNDAVCLHAIRLVAEALPRAVAAPDDLVARGRMLIAAAAAGVGIDNTGTGVAHAVGTALGSIAHVHHGRSVGLSLRAALAWNAEASPVRHAAVAAALGVPAEGREARAVAADLAPAYDRFLRTVGLTVSLASDGLSAADIPRLASATMAHENSAMRDSNIRPIGDADAARIATEMLTAA